MSNNKVQIYDQIVKRDPDGNIVTTADVYSFSNTTDSITLANLQNYSNNELDFEKMEVGNTVYATDSGLSFRFTDIDDLFVYLGDQEECPDCGAGSIIYQNIPEQFVTLVIPEEEYRISKSCKTCGCIGAACECTEVSEVTLEERTYTVKVSDAYTITANVTEQSCEPPYIKVSGANGKFLPSYPIICNNKELLVVGSQTEISKNISSGNYIVNRPAIFLSNCETTNCFNYGLYDGAHIGIDRHFNGKRSQDYNDDFIIVCDQGTETKVPIGYMSSYQGIGMNITGYGAASSKILNLKTTGNTQGEFVVYTRGGTEIKTNLPNSDTINIVNVKNYNTNILSVSSNTIIYEKNLICNSVLSVKSYGERYSNSRVNSQFANLDLRTNGTFFLPTGVDNLRFIKPNTSQKEAFSVITISSEGTNFAQTTWPGANVRWPGGVGPANVSSGAILSFMNFHDPADTLANNNIWYAFGSANGNYGGGTTFIWDKSNVAAIINVTYSWTSSGGEDLDTRTWLTTPFSSRSWEDRPVGWNFEQEVYIGPKGKPVTLDRITFSGDDTTSSGWETILIPMDTILFNTGELRANNAYVDLHLGAYWYDIRNSGNFTVRITNETYGSSIVFTQNVPHRDTVGIGRNEFAVFRIDMKYLNITRIS